MLSKNCESFFQPSGNLLDIFYKLSIFQAHINICAFAEAKEISSGAKQNIAGMQPLSSFDIKFFICAKSNIFQQIRKRTTCSSISLILRSGAHSGVLYQANLKFIINLIQRVVLSSLDGCRKKLLTKRYFLSWPSGTCVLLLSLSACRTNIRKEQKSAR